MIRKKLSFFLSLSSSIPRLKKASIYSHQETDTDLKLAKAVGKKRNQNGVQHDKNISILHSTPFHSFPFT